LRSDAFLALGTILFRPEGIRHLVAEFGAGHVMVGTGHAGHANVRWTASSAETP